MKITTVSHTCIETTHVQYVEKVLQLNVTVTYSKKAPELFYFLTVFRLWYYLDKYNSVYYTYVHTRVQYGILHLVLVPSAL